MAKARTPASGGRSVAAIDTTPRQAGKGRGKASAALSVPSTPPRVSETVEVAAASALLEGFPPVVAADTHTMVFGSFPGVASLSATQYYAHPQNQFWRLLGAVLDEPLPSLPYIERLQRLLAHQIGVWDVLAACERTGSLDAAIRNASPNDFAALRRRAPSLRKVCFNGKTAGRFEPVMREAGYETLVLPSSSPANAMLSFEQKLVVWRGII